MSVDSLIKMFEQYGWPGVLAVVCILIVYYLLDLIWLVKVKKINNYHKNIKNYFFIIKMLKQFAII